MSLHSASALLPAPANHDLESCLRRAAVVLLLLLSVCSVSHAQEELVRAGEVGGKPGLALFPFAFYNDMMGAAVALAAVTSSWPQPQSSLFLTAFAGSKGTNYLYAKASDLRPFPHGRLYATSRLTLGYFDAMKVFSDGHPDFADARAGANDSDPDNYLEGNGLDQEAWLRLHYLLPLGQGRYEKMHRLVLRDGIVVEGARDTWPPLPWKTGYTMLGVRPFYRSQDLSLSHVGDFNSTTIGSDFFVEYDATDFSDDPTRGSRIYAAVSRDWGSGASSNSWTQAMGSATGYLPLGSGTHTRRLTLALSVWTSHCLTWNSADAADGDPVYHRPPTYAGASLGGMDRMRAYAPARFNDRSALVYQAELRQTLRWNPLEKIALLQKLGMRIDWLQLVYGLEAGRVAPGYDLSTLHQAMKVNGLLGLRLLVNQLVIRVDLGVGSEGGAVQMISDHAF